MKGVWINFAPIDAPLQLKFYKNKPTATPSKPKRKKMKSVKNLSKRVWLGLPLALMIGASGCSSTRQLPPSFYALGTSTAISLAVRNSPQTTAYLRSVQPIVCSLATGVEITPAQIALAVEQFAPSGSPEATVIANSVMMLYIVAYNSVGTNALMARPYAQAIFCDGFAAGLGMSTPMSKTKGLPAVPTYKPNPVWPLLRAKD